MGRIQVGVSRPLPRSATRSRDRCRRNGATRLASRTTRPAPRARPAVVHGPRGASPETVSSRRTSSAISVAQRRSKRRRIFSMSIMGRTATATFQRPRRPQPGRDRRQARRVVQSSRLSITNQVLERFRLRAPILSLYDSGKQLLMSRDIRLRCPATSQRAPGRIRTCDLDIRSVLLCPTELRERVQYFVIPKLRRHTWG